ncbi:MAG: hypothetical protein Q4C78_00055 [Synergistaceae bacterium]|nr:hypothetical protein [Synergistaceae bacterium]
MSIFVSATESSADHYIARLVKSLREVGYTDKIFALGGVEVRQTDAEIVQNGDELQVMGLFDVVFALPKILKIFNKVLNFILENNCTTVIVCDGATFHMKLAKALRKKGYKGRIVYVSPPTVWAWKRWRVRDLRKNIDLCLPLFRFEHEFLLKHNVKSLWQSYPLKQEAQENILASKWSLGTDTVAFLPGSRRGEIKRLLPILQDVAHDITARGHHVIFSVAPGLAKDTKRLLKEELKNNNLPYYEGSGQDLLYACDVAVIASGTVTVQALLANCYSIIVYRISNIAGYLARILIPIRFFGMANILANNEIFPELLQEHCTKENILHELEAYWNGQKGHDETYQALLSKAKESFGSGDTYRFWASQII